MSRRRYTPSFTATPPENKLRLNMEMSVDLRELATWPEATSRAFLIGISQVLAAQQMAEVPR